MRSRIKTSGQMFSFRTVVFFQVVAFVVCLCARAQVIGTGRVDLQVRLYEEGRKQLFHGDATVELLDMWSMPEAERDTAHGSILQFYTGAGAHYLRISGADVENTMLDFMIPPGERLHVEEVEVQRRRNPALGKHDTQTGPVPAIRLRIPKKARKRFEAGAKALEKQDWNTAAARFQEAVQLYPQYDMACNGLGLALLSAGDLVRARPAFSKAIELNPNYAEAYRNLAHVSLAQNNYPEADSLLVKSLALDPQNAWALSYAALAELKLGDRDNAIVHARKLHSLPHAGMASVHLIAARALEEEGNKDDAIIEYELYLKEAPGGSNAELAQQALARLSVHR